MIYLQFKNVNDLSIQVHQVKPINAYRYGDRIQKNILSRPISQHLEILQFPSWPIATTSLSIMNEVTDSEQVLGTRSTISGNFLVIFCLKNRIQKWGYYLYTKARHSRYGIAMHHYTLNCINKNSLYRTDFSAQQLYYLKIAAENSHFFIGIHMNLSMLFIMFILAIE